LVKEMHVGDQHVIGFVEFSETWNTIIRKFFRRNTNTNREIIWHGNLK